MWVWTLNWNQVRDDLVIGSCPMTAADIDSIRRKTGVSAILSLQHPECHRYFKIDYMRHLHHGRSTGLVMVHCPMRDFDPPDQRRHLAAAVRNLHALLAAGHKVYVHCTAGINRAPLAVLAYLTFVEGLTVAKAMALIRRARPAAEPSWEAYYGCRQDLIDRHRDTISLRAWSIWNDTGGRGPDRDWMDAEAGIIREVLSGSIPLFPLTLATGTNG